MSKNKIVVLSDIHIGTNSPTNWYQQNFHEPYLSAILDYVIKNAADIQELILLGDIFDFWTYPPDRQPPSYIDTLNANPNILGINGKLSQALTALEGRVIYLNGNHDINVTQSDLQQIQNSAGYQIKYYADPIYYFQTAAGKKIAFTHGHTFTLFNAPDTQTPLSPLPVGFFVTRSVGYQLNKTLKPGQTVADLPGQGSPNGINLDALASLIWNAISSISSGSFNLVDTVLNYIMKVTGMPENEPIILPDGQTTTIAQAKTTYSNLQNQWISDWGGGDDGILALVKSAIADLNGTYIAWFAQQSALTSGSDLIVLGHTHTPKQGLTNGLVQYTNDGFECPSSPDIPSQTFTFSVVDTDNCQASLYQVVKQNNDYQISSFSAPPDSVINSPSSDFSSYIIIDNTNGKSTLNLTNSTKISGHYVVAPPKQISPGQQGKFWLQDYPGLVGSQGTATYSLGNQSLELTYACPTTWFNSCSGANFYTSNDGVNWGELNQIQKSGHPFFVKFVL
ncbi:metallophosphoesterase [Nostoc sp. FACHB-973]|nr:metallophosphoesterase [Nostoc sp. FACHB-973]